MTGITEDAQNVANTLVDTAQELANSVVDLGEEAIGTVLGAAVTANKLIGEVFETLASKITSH